MSADQFMDIENAAHAGAYGMNPRKEPTDGQKAAGNYTKGTVTYQGLPIAIEQPRGTYRTGVSANGKRWTTRMAAHYGYFKGFKGADGDGVDCFIGFYPQSEQVFIINQSVDGRFDEHKVMCGFPDQESAVRAYRDSYDRSWKGLDTVVPASLSQLKWWLKNGKKSLPLRDTDLPFEGLETMSKNVKWDSAALPEGMSIDVLLYEIRRSDAGEGLLMDAVTLAEIMEDCDGTVALDALVTPYAKLDRKMEQLRGIMERVGQSVKPVAMQITEPFKQRGVVNVAAIYELSDGQTVSVYLHNPDTTPSKLAPTDELISWKWMLNKKDITIVVAPERGEDLNPREVARRIMKLAEKNSPAFQRANSKRTETMGRLQGLKDEIAGLQTELNQAQRELEVAKVEAEGRSTKEAPITDEDRQKMADQRETLNDFLATNPNSPSADAWRKKLEEINSKIGVKEVVKKEKKDLTPVDTTGWSDASVKAYEISQDYKKRTYELANDTGAMGAFKRKLRTVAKTIPSDDEKAVSLIDMLVTRVYGTDYNPKLSEIEFAEPTPAADPVMQALSGIKTRFTENKEYDLPQIVMNAPRPLVGNKTVENGEFLTGRYYAMIDIGDSMATKYVQSNARDDAVVVLYASREQMMEMAIADTEYRDAYMEMPLEKRWDAVQGLINRIQNLPYTEAKSKFEAAKAATAGETVAPEVVEPMEAFNHEGFNIYPTKINVGGEAQTRWTVQSIDNLAREQRNERQVGGDALFSTKEEAMAEAERQVKVMEQDAERERKAAQGKEASDAAIAAKASEYADIGDIEGETPMQRGRRVKALDTQVRNNGVIKTKKVKIDELVAAGATTSTQEEDRIKPLSYTASLRGGNPAEDDHKRKIKEGGKVTVYLISNPMSDDGEYEIGKVEYDYANYLIGKRQADLPQPEVINPEQEEPAMSADKQADIALYQSVIDGTVADILAPELADQLEAAYYRHAGDAEMDAMFEQAVNAYQAAMLAATANL